MSEMALFEERPVRRVFHNEEWWFVLTDIVSALTDSPAPSDYLKKLRRRDPSLAEAFKGGGQIVPPLALPFETEGGVQRLQCWNVPGVLRLIQSIPSPKAEPFKRWLAKVGYERLQEIADPALALERTRENWRKLGRSEKWITQRMTGPCANHRRAQQADRLLGCSRDKAGGGVRHPHQYHSRRMVRRLGERA